MFFKLNKSKTSLPALSWFYIPLAETSKWNPHIHCLLSEGGFSDDGFWRHVSHFNYSYLRNAFRHCTPE
ncbi:MAG: transposase [Coprococcus phoceensis]